MTKKPIYVNIRRLFIVALASLLLFLIPISGEEKGDKKNLKQQIKVKEIQKPELEKQFEARKAQFEKKRNRRLATSLRQANKFLSQKELSKLEVKSDVIAPQIQEIEPLKIYYLSRKDAEPGDALGVVGIGFKKGTEVHLMVAEDRDVKATRVELEEDGKRLRTFIPDLSGLLIREYKGFVYLKRGTMKSNIMPFTFKPEIVLDQLRFTKNMLLECSTIPYLKPGRYAHTISVHEGLIDCRDTEMGSKVNVKHTVPGWEEQVRLEGEDKFFLTCPRLKNGWVVDHVFFDPPQPGPAVAELVHSSPESNSPFVRVDWWVEPQGYCYYRLLISIRGPKGVAYW